MLPKEGKSQRFGDAVRWLLKKQPVINIFGLETNRVMRKSRIVKRHE